MFNQKPAINVIIHSQYEYFLEYIDIFFILLVNIVK